MPRPMHELTPRDIVDKLDRHIIGQHAAKRAVAVAVRNRWRRQQLEGDLSREVMPRNIIMIGPTGVGKTEIARRLAKLVHAPFLKVEASKFTEVGYHGRDVESMIRDLLELGINMVRREQAERVQEEARERAEERLVSLLLGEEQASEPTPPPTSAIGDVTNASTTPNAEEVARSQEQEAAQHERVRQRLLKKLRDGFFDEREIEITVREKQTIPVMGMMGPDQMDPGMTNMLEGLMPDRSRQRRVKVARARTILIEQETEKLIDHEKTIEQAIERTEQTGIIFLDEIDKIAGASDGRGSNADVSRQGVQRDLLPIVEGSSVVTRQGVVQTDQILFIAAGAFHSASVSDLMPELQGRFPIRVELDSLTREDFARILIEPDASLTRQQEALLSTEGLTIKFTSSSIDAMAEMAAEANASMENIGARRLMTVIEQVFAEISFDAPDLVKKGTKKIEITEAFVRERLAEIMADEDLTKFVL